MTLGVNSNHYPPYFFHEIVLHLEIAHLLWHNNSYVQKYCKQKEDQEGDCMSVKDTRIKPYTGEKIKIHPYEHKAQYYETDQMGIIHHSNYIRWMEEARMDLMDQMGFSYKAMEEMEIISPVLSVKCEYKSMVHFRDTVVIEARMVDYNSVKMKIVYRMTDKETGELRAVAQSEHCFLSNSGKPISLKRSYPEIDTKFFTLYDEDGEEITEF